MRSRALVSTLVLTSCFAMQTVVVAPRLAVRSDSAARAAFDASAMALLRQVAREDSLEPSEASEPYGINWTACFRHQKARLQVCGRVENSVMRIQFVQNGRFYGRGDSLRREVIERLRGAFGEKRVREGRFNWRGFEKCPPLSQIDSGA